MHKDLSKAGDTWTYWQVFRKYKKLRFNDLRAARLKAAKTEAKDNQPVTQTISTRDSGEVTVSYKGSRHKRVKLDGLHSEKYKPEKKEVDENTQDKKRESKWEIDKVIASSKGKVSERKSITALVILMSPSSNVLAAIKEPINGELLIRKLLETIEKFGKPEIVRFNNYWGPAILEELKCFCIDNDIKLEVHYCMGQGTHYSGYYKKMLELLD